MPGPGLWSGTYAQTHKGRPRGGPAVVLTPLGFAGTVVALGHDQHDAQCRIAEPPPPTIVEAMPTPDLSAAAPSISLRSASFGPGAPPRCRR